MDMTGTLIVGGYPGLVFLEEGILLAGQPNQSLAVPDACTRRVICWPCCRGTGVVGCWLSTVQMNEFHLTHNLID